MRIFRKKTRTQEARTDRMLNGITRIGEALQTRWAVWMNKKTSGFSAAKWKVLLMAFVISTGSASIYLTASNLILEPKKLFKVQSINIPNHSNGTELIIPELNKVPNYDYTSIRGFRKYIDSLARSPDGRKVYDSILQLHPGLLDSLRHMETQLK